MTFGDDFTTFLLSNAAIAARVGDRVRQNDPLLIDPPKGWGAKQFIVYERRSVQEELDLDGGGGVLETLLDVACVGSGPDEAETLGNLVRRWVNGYRGQWGTREIMGAILENAEDDRQPLLPGGDESRNHVELTFRIFSRD
jgi:hypothetical protein